MSRFLALSTVTRAGIALLAIIVNHAPALAHDMWIHPTTFRAEPGAIVGVQLRVGENLVGEPVRRHSTFIDQFVFVDHESKKPVVGRDGADPAGLLRVSEAGLVVIGYRSRPRALETTAHTFNQYLKEEGLEAVAALRAKRGETGARGREVFSRCAKSLVLAGQASETQADRPLGFTLELVAERNPYATPFGQDVPFRLTYENRPLAGALVVAINSVDPSEKLSARTDEDGRVRFRFHQRGMWLVKAVHMVPAPKAANADWASYWASLTFSLND